MAEGKHSSVSSYIIVALILGVITYIEFAIVEYPQAWLGTFWTMFWLIALSIVKFVMVIMFFMHLKDDDKTYTGFFSSGMFISLATFIGLTAMFILPRAVATTKPEMPVGQVATSEVPQALLDSVATGGASRSASERADSPAVANRSMSVTPPTASNDASSYSVGLANAAEADAPEPAEAPAAPSVTEAEATEAEADESTEPEAPAEDTQPAAPAATEAVVAEWDVANGATAFNSSCMSCHQMTGTGIPGAFPPLANNVNRIYEAGGVDYLVDAVLFGLQGEITVAGMTYDGIMPAWSHLADANIADALNHALTAWTDAPEGFTPYTADDVAARREHRKSVEEVYRSRLALSLR